MSIDKGLFTQLIRDFNFKELFNELGWENAVKEESITLGSETYKLEAAAEKRGFVIFVCNPDSRGKMPDYSARKKIDRAVTNLYFEHIIIYTDQSKNQQVWQLVIREQGKPAVVRETPFYSHQEPELLFQRLKGLFFSIDDEERISIVDVKSRIHEQFNINAEKVTRQFYDKFKKEHNAFLEFIKGINDIADKEWYASLMLNRLMFIYFIQKKGFLDNNKDYLRDKLNVTKEKKGKNKFYSFYKHFLLVLFHKGLGSPERTDSLIKDIGNIPYLNGGLFDAHRIEDEYSNIKIEDRAFEQIFNFFDQYEWHLDTRVTASGRDINPDVIGYIFEKYINDRAAMGAYYTKEDITEYISKNCIIPYLFDEVKRNYPKAMSSDSEIWTFLKEEPDRYIYDAVKFGVKNDLPPEIECGIKEVSKRTEWNRPAPIEYALPTEIWREVVERRKRYFDIISKIEKDEITEINDFITYNLNIRQFAQDIIENTSDPDLIRHFYKALSSITVLDPTCGSGAFLFAALNILEPLYEACIMRMENFVSESKKGKYKFFEQILSELKSPSHPNLQYFIFKSIILNNLYGVDIMNEAVEIAKLRLFLKLMAAVDADYKKPNVGLEPLPDVDFNIRAGNTLVGFATLEELQSSIQSALDFDNNAEKFREKAEIVSTAYKRFKDEQLTSDKGEQSYRQAKQELNNRLAELNKELDNYTAKSYGIDVNKKSDYIKWNKSHRPFHWFSEFYEIVHEKGGFDVIIGNPPYVEYSKVKKSYTVIGYETEKCGNLYAYVLENSYNILAKNGFFGFIVQLPIVCTDRMIPLQNICLGLSKSVWFSNFDDRPGKLFDGLEHIRATIIISQKEKVENSSIFSTNYNRWYSENRPTLFDQLNYVNVNDYIIKGSIPKIGHPLSKSIRSKINSHKQLKKYLLPDNRKNILYFHNAPGYWIRAMNFVPYFWNEKDKEKISVQVKPIYLESYLFQKIIVSVINSSLFYWWFIILSDCRHLNLREIENFPIGLENMSANIIEQLSHKTEDLMNDLIKNSMRKECYYKSTGQVKYDEFYPSLSKPIIDEIDRVLAEHYGFTEEELDFIINYDIKYRMGKELYSDD